jgi:ribosomal protein S18 acetylase RimI-like enzyme
MVTLRPYHTDDHAKVTALWLSAGLELRPSDSKIELEKKLLRDPELFVVVEEDGGKIVGAAIGAFDGRRGFVYHLAVAPDRQGRGIGQIIMEDISEKLRQLGAIRLLLLVDEDNQKAVDFYRGFGMQQNRMHVMSKNLVE